VEDLNSEFENHALDGRQFCSRFDITPHLGFRVPVRQASKTFALHDGDFSVRGVAVRDSVLVFAGGNVAHGLGCNSRVWARWFGRAINLRGIQGLLPRARRAAAR
jgi:hypothetical protein